MSSTVILTLGVALWWVAHLFKRLAPGPRARLGDPARRWWRCFLVGSVC